MTVQSAMTATEVRLKSVLVATDFSALSNKALRHGIAIARHFGAKLYLFHVVSSLGLTLAGADAVTAATELAHKDALLLEKQLLASGVLRDLKHDIIVREGDIRAELHKVVRQENIDLVVLGTHSRTGISRLVLGSVAERIFRDAPCMVLTVGPHSPAEIEFDRPEKAGPILFTTDFSESSLTALPYAIAFANKRKTRLVLLHMLAAVPSVDGNRWYTPEDVITMRKEAQQSARERLHQLLAHAALELEPMPMAEFGEPAQGILWTADKMRAEVIILGLHRKTHIETISRLPWSTAYNVVCGASCPVLTVRC